MVLMSFLLGMVSFSGCSPNGIEIKDADNGKQITIQPGNVMTVALVSNPTTGYSWQVMRIDEAILLQKGDPEYKQSPGTEGLVGSGGVETFQFEAIGSGETTLTLGYMRVWESVPPIETFTIQVIVQ